MDVYVCGVGFTKISEHWRKPLRVLMAEAGLKAIDDSGGLDPELVIVSSALSPLLQRQSHLAPLLLEEMGLNGKPAFSVESGGASGAMAFHAGVMAVAAGLYDPVLVVGGEKLSDVLPMDVVAALQNFEDREHVSFYGITWVSLAALLYKSYLSSNGVRREDVASLAVHDHEMAVGVEHAQYPFPVKLEAVLRSTVLADPITLLESFGYGDGAAAILISRRKSGDGCVRVAGMGVATENSTPASKIVDISFKSTVNAAEKAYRAAKIDPSSIDVAEIYDPYTIIGIVSMEDLGFAERGKAAKLVAEGEVKPGGRIPINTFGGLKARGNPIGATGLYQIAEIVLQLRGEAVHQVPSPKYGLAHSMGGFGGTSVVTILEG